MRIYIRSDVMPWAYELSYLALLYQTGLVGLGIYATGIAWIYFMGVKILRSGGMFAESMLPLLVGMTCFLVANATNPYLAKFDGLWIIFLPTRSDQFVARAATQRRIYRPEKSTTCSAKPGIVSLRCRSEFGTQAAPYLQNTNHIVKILFLTSIFASRERVPAVTGSGNTCLCSNVRVSRHRRCGRFLIPAI